MVDLKNVKRVLFNNDLEWHRYILAVMQAINDTPIPTYLFDCRIAKRDLATIMGDKPTWEIMKTRREKFYICKATVMKLSADPQAIQCEFLPELIRDVEDVDSFFEFCSVPADVPKDCNDEEVADTPSKT